MSGVSNGGTELRVAALEQMLRDVMRELPSSDSMIERHARLQRLHKRAIMLLGTRDPGDIVMSSYWIDEADV